MPCKRGQTHGTLNQIFFFLNVRKNITPNWYSVQNLFTKDVKLGVFPQKIFY